MPDNKSDNPALQPGEYRLCDPVLTNGMRLARAVQLPGSRAILAPNMPR